MGRAFAYLIVFCAFALMLVGAVWSSMPKPKATTASAAISTTSEAIQSKARVFDLPDPRGGSTLVGIMAAYEPNSHAFWWRAVPFIAEPGMLERYLERCKFQMAGDKLLNFCVRGNEVVVTTTSEYAQSLDQGLEGVQSRLQTSPGLLMNYRGPRDTGFNLQQKARVDMNTAEGVPPTVVRSLHKTASGWELDVTCGCGNALITVNDNFDFVAIKRN